MATNGNAMTNEQLSVEVVETRYDNLKLLARIAELERQVVNSRPSKGIKVSEKKAVSVYGIQRFPVTLYAQGWIELAKQIPNVLAFIEANKGNLSWKE